MEIQTNINGLVDEYYSLLQNIDTNEPNSINKVLINKGDWTPRAAEHLQKLAENYGSFMLRNALAISIALEIEDGDLGF